MSIEGPNYKVVGSHINFLSDPNNRKVVLPKNQQLTPESLVLSQATIPVTFSNPATGIIYDRIWIDIDSGDGNGSDALRAITAVKLFANMIRDYAGYDHAAFKALIPFNTRTLSETCKSVFLPFTLNNKQWYLTLITLICDIVTLPFRLLTLTFRAIYQNCLQESCPILTGGITTVKDIDWSRGTVNFPVFTESEEGENYILTAQDITVYLG